MSEMYAAVPRGRCGKSGLSKPARFCPLLAWYTDRAKRSGVLFVLLWFSIFGGSARKRALPSVWFLTGRNHEPAADASLAAGTDALGNRDNVCGISVIAIAAGHFCIKNQKTPAD